ncbi:prepilin-type N-terminal cleavage/methylation domain-containing protein [Bacillus alkalicellulosilyticus]|uniref:prepilin-type N-terminal cleavage/methylation domain-containing protein n=1 Tax=Alkalihalobacterium alkalicellulosilyticum TaxID=1912214 RepID=UPI001117115A|nr:prepilin-type N-terminal cleavage/methylation domain-containing protein [Bacillus alkalicellulosilyticus]
MKNSKGFTLFEVVTALFLVVMTTSFITPVLVKVYQEKRTIQEKQWIQEYMHDTMQRWVYEVVDIPQTLENKGTSYRLDTNINVNVIELCAYWNGKNQRTYHWCHYGKK